MDTFWKASAIVILTIVLRITLEKSQKDIAVVLIITACCAVMIVALQYLSHVIRFLWELTAASEDTNHFMPTLLKISGIAFMTEFICVISSDSGNNSLAKVMQFLGTVAILFLSLPLFETFFSILQEIMRNL
jgi:stage III sporulation protein AD